jgi:hypothetical protein
VKLDFEISGYKPITDVSKIKNPNNQKEEKDGDNIIG